MSYKYHIGDKFVIEIEDIIERQGVPDVYYKMKGFRSLLFDEYGIKKLKHLKETKTRKSEFLKLFPKATLDDMGNPCTDPCELHGNMYEDGCQKLHCGTCSQCRSRYWNEVIE